MLERPWQNIQELAQMIPHRQGYYAQKRVMHVIRALLARVHYFIPTKAASKAGRRMTFFTPLQGFVLKNEKKLPVELNIRLIIWVQGSGKSQFKKSQWIHHRGHDGNKSLKKNVQEIMLQDEAIRIERQDSHINQWIVYPLVHLISISTLKSYALSNEVPPHHELNFSGSPGLQCLSAPSLLFLKAAEESFCCIRNGNDGGQPPTQQESHQSRNQNGKVFFSWNII